MGHLASCMSFTAICAAMTSPSNFSTTTSPPLPVLCRVSRPRPCPPSRDGLGGGQWPQERAGKLLEIVLANYQSPDALALALCRRPICRAGKSILAKIRKRANSAAVDRFNRESKVSGIIRADQLSRSTNAQISGTVDIIGSTQRFQSYPAYEQLKNEFNEMGVSVSDYALVMDKYEFSMKDLLERGPGEALLDQAVRAGGGVRERQYS